MQKNSGYIANHAVILQPCDQTPFLSSLFNDESNNVSTAQHQSMATNRQISQMRNTPSNRDRYMAIHAPIFQGMPVYIPPPGYVMMSHSPTPSPSPYSEQENDPLYRPYHLAGMRQKMIQGGGPAKNKSLKQKLPGFAMFSNNKRPKLDSAGNIVEGDDKLDDDVMYQPDDVMDQQRLVQYTGMPPPQMVGDFRSPVSVMNPPDFYVSELRQNNQIMENAQYMTGIQYPDQSKMMEGQIMPNQYQNIPMPKVHQDGTYKEVQEVHDVDKEDDTMDELEEISDNEIENRSKIKEGDDSDSDYIKHSPDAMSRVARRPCTRVPNAAGGDQEDLESGDEGYLDKEKQVNVCNFCGKSFPSNSSLKVHTNLHTGNKPHICSFCKRGFGDPSNLKRHLRIHTRSRPYTCHLCPTSFNQSSHLVRHIRSHTSRGCHKTCRFCSASFPHYSNLRRHSEKCAERRKRENILLIQDTKQSSGESLAFKLPHLTSDKQDFEMPEHLIPHNQDKMQYEQQDLYNNPHMHHDTYSRLCNEKPSGLQ